MTHSAIAEWLAAERAHPALADAAATFDRFVGSWDLDCVFTAADGTSTETTGEWHFGWILGGRAMQDVLFFYPAGERPLRDVDLQGGTSLRLYDRESRQWQVSWFAGTSGNVIHLRGDAVGDRIELLGRDVDGSALRWSFNEIADTGFRWLGEVSPDGGSTWRVEQEMHVRRRPDAGDAA